MPTKPTGLVPLRAILDESDPVRRERRLRLWWSREFAEDATPRAMTSMEWLQGLALIAERDEGGYLPLRASFVQLVRRSRPGGRPFFEPVDAVGGSARPADLWTKVADPSVGTVLRWWGARIGGAAVAPPLPFDHPKFAPFSVLRSDWLKTGDWIGVDHRERGSRARFELGAAGRPMLSDFWDSEPATPAGGKPKVLRSGSGPYSDHLEWTFRAGGRRIERSAVMLRGRKLAILGERVDGGGPHGTTLGIAEGVTAEFPNSDGFARVRLAGSGSAWMLAPNGLEVGDGRIALTTRGGAAREWLPLVIGWGRAPTTFRRLTVAENLKTCPPETAVAFRLGWGRSDDGLLIYRSLAKPALRTVLGHQARDRFLVARFSPEGRATPILQLE